MLEILLLMSDFQNTPIPHLIAAASESNRVIISGPLVEVGSVNLNGWGIDEDEVENYMKGIVGIPIRKCSGPGETIAEHSCDYNWNPKDDIGRILRADVKDGWVHATGEVTDTIAKTKIVERTWDPLWSAFLSRKTQHKNLMVSGTKPLSVTLVKNPAYVGSGFSVQTPTSIMEASMTDTKTYEQGDVDKLVAAAAEAATKEATKEATKDMLSKADAEALVSAAVESESKKAEGLLSKEQSDELISAAVKDALKESEDADGKETISKYEAERLVSAAVATATKDSIPRTEVETLLAASVEKATEATIGKLEKQALIQEVVDIQISAGLIKKEEIQATVEGHMLKSADALRADKHMLSTMQEALVSAGTAAVDKFKEAAMPTGSGVSGFTVGNFNNGKEWSDK